MTMLSMDAQRSLKRAMITAALPLLACGGDAQEPASKPAEAAQLTGSTDWDGDYVDDDLEEDLASKFFPHMNMHCGTYEGVEYGSQGQFYGTDRGFAVNGRLAYTAHIYADGRLDRCAESGRCIEIRYAMAYNWDLGDDNPLAPVFEPNNSHRGDSEIVSLLLATEADWSIASIDPSVWYVWKVYRSAHGCGDGHSSFQEWNSFDVPENWVAEGKNSNYPSQDACNNGGTLDADDCGDNRCWINRDHAISKLTNAGEFGDPTLGEGAGHIPRSRYTDGFVGANSADAVIPDPGSPTPNSTPYGYYDIWGPRSFGTAGKYCKHMTRFLDWSTHQELCQEHPNCPSE